MKKADVFLTGSTGFMGSAILEKLISHKYETTCFVRDSEKGRSLQKRGIATTMGNLSNEEPDIGDAGVVVHCAGIVSVKDAIEHPKRIFQENTAMTLNVLEAMRKGSAKTIIFPSTDRVYGSPKSDIVDEETLPCALEPYSAAKITSEQLCQSYCATYGMSYVTLRIANVFGPGQTSDLFIPSITRKIINSDTGVIGVGNTKTSRNFIYIKDVADLFYFMLANLDRAKNSTFNAGSYLLEIGQILDMLSGISMKHLNKKINFVTDPKMVRPASTEIKKFLLDSNKIKGLGWEPKYKFEKALEETFKSYCP